MRLNNKVVLITASTRGIGLACAAACAKEGAAVYMAARDPARAQKTADELSSGGARVYTVFNDAAVPESFSSMVEETVSREGRIDALVNNFGASDPSRDLDLSRTDPDVFLNTVCMNLRSVFIASQAAARHMARTGGGSIINISSIAGQRVSDALTHPNPPYYAAKAAVDNITRFFAIEFGSHGIRVNAIAPGPFHSQLDELMDPVMYENATKNMPMHRFGDCIELGAHCVYLSSPAGAHITGTVQVHDGGLMQVV